MQDIERAVEVVDLPVFALGEERLILEPVIAGELALRVNQTIEDHPEDDALQWKLEGAFILDGAQGLADPEFIPDGLEQLAKPQLLRAENR